MKCYTKVHKLFERIMMMPNVCLSGLDEPGYMISGTSD